MIMGFSRGIWRSIKDRAIPITNLFARPLLKIAYATFEEPNIIQLVDPNVRAAYYRIDVTNHGNRCAKDCQGFLDVVKPVKLASFYGGNLARVPERLKWANGGSYDSVNIDPHAPPRKLDLFHVYENSPMNMHFPIKPPQTAAGTTSSVATDQYLLNVRIDHDSDRYITVTLIVKPADRFDRFSIDIHTGTAM